MTETSTSTPAPVPTLEDRTFPAIAYGLYLLGFVNGLTFVIGLILAYAQRDRAGPVERSHYQFLIRTFWLALGAMMLGGALFVVGLPLSLVLIGIPLMALGGLLMSVAGLWLLVRCVLGAIHLARGEAYPRPNAWLF